MKNLLSIGLLTAFLAFPRLAPADYIGVMADEATGAVVPASLEERLVAVDMSGVVEDISDLQEDFSLVWGLAGELQSNMVFCLRADSLFNLSNDLATASGRISSLSNSVLLLSGAISTNATRIANLSNSVKRADSMGVRIDPANGTATLSLSNNYYYVYAVDTSLTNWVVERPTGGGALYRLEINFSTNTPFAWGGDLASCTNLPVPPPAGLSSYVLELMVDGTNFNAYQ